MLSIHVAKSTWISGSLGFHNAWLQYCVLFSQATAFQPVIFVVERMNLNENGKKDFHLAEGKLICSKATFYKVDNN